MSKQKIIKTGANTFKTTENTKVSENAGDYTLTGTYIKSNKERKGSVVIKESAIEYVETLDVPENE